MSVYELASVTISVANGMSNYLISRNPADGFRVLGKVARTTPAEAAYKINKLNKAREAWTTLDYAEKCQLIRGIKERLTYSKDKIAELITRETGKPISESFSEVDRSIQYIDYCINGVSAAIKPIRTRSSCNIDEIRFEARGIALIILSWNFPLLLFVWWVIPNLLAGNVTLVKASEYVPITAQYLFEYIVSQSDFYIPVEMVFGKRREVNQALGYQIDFVCFTGSSKSGLSISQKLARCNIPSIMELGGSNPAIICDDASISDCMLELIYKSRFKNSGQTCTAIKRMLVHESLESEFIERFASLVRSKKTGDPFAPDTDIGSLISNRQVSQIESQLLDALTKGATVVIGGVRPTHLSGAYFLPTVLSDVTQIMKVWKDEVFGPLIPVMKFADDDEAIAAANNSPYGLGATVISADSARADRIAKQLKVGMVDINRGRCSAPYNPFGGIKNSGHGYQHGEIGFRNLCNIKVISRDHEVCSVEEIIVPNTDDRNMQHDYTA